MRHASFDDGNGKGSCDDDRRKQFQIGRFQSELQYDRDDDSVDNRTENDGRKPIPKRKALSEHDFPDDDRRKSDNDDARSHADVRVSLTLRDESARQRDETVCEHETEYLHRVRVDAERTHHVIVAAGRPDCAADFRSEKPIHKCDDTHDKDGADGKRSVRRGKAAPVGKKGHHRIDAEQRRVRFSHNADIDGIQRDHREDAREQHVYFYFRVQETGRKTRKHTRRKSRRKRKERMHTVRDEHA